MVYLREATMQDMDLIYEWANDPAVRINSFNSEPIQYDTHVKWYNRIMSDESVLQFILMDDDTPVGQIRLNIDGDEAEIGYSIASAYRGKGYGHKVLQLVAEKVKADHHDIRCLVAKVKPENIASSKLFEREGYETKYTCYKLQL